jgi:hypothetical protein
MLLKDKTTAQKLRIEQATAAQKLANNDVELAMQASEAAIRNAGLIAKARIDSARSPLTE